jgi:hypothetical protein
MVIGRQERREAREARVVEVFGRDQASAALDLLELVEYAWHDCYGEISPSEDLVDDLLLLSGGRLEALVEAGRLAVIDWRDVRFAADRLRQGG